MHIGKIYQNTSPMDGMFFHAAPISQSKVGLQCKSSGPNVGKYKKYEQLNTTSILFGDLMIAV